ncbi:MAG: tripartite tricarboxylate transporter substrate binding protein [Burkholderiaceae bacterium]|nr:MAG: tripartite tricarboxylate transporter substrate binding protein [Burkholderiaceae bacterium]
MPLIATSFRRGLAAGFGLAALLGSGAAQAQGYPNRPITLIAPYSAGGDADMAARTFAAAATRALGQSVVVLNKTGASGIIGSAQAIAAPADGYTLLLARPGSQSILPAIMPTMTKYKWDDYTFIGTLELNPYGCVVSAKSNYRTFGDLVEALKTGGGKLNFGTAGVLTTNDMGPRQLFKMLKLNAQNTPTQIPYKGTGEASTSLLAGQTDFACGSLGSFIGLIKGGQLRALMVTTPERMNIFPDVPTSRELGYTEMEGIVGWSGIYGPPNLPADVRERLAAMLKTIAADPAWQAGTAQTGSLPYVKPAEETREFARKQYELYRSLGEMLDLIDKAKM